MFQHLLFIVIVQSAGFLISPQKLPHRPVKADPVRQTAGLAELCVNTVHQVAGHLVITLAQLRQHRRSGGQIKMNAEQYGWNHRYDNKVQLKPLSKCHWIPPHFRLYSVHFADNTLFIHNHKVKLHNLQSVGG